MSSTNRSSERPNCSRTGSLTHFFLRPIFAVVFVVVLAWPNPAAQSQLRQRKNPWRSSQSQQQAQNFRRTPSRTPYPQQQPQQQIPIERTTQPALPTAPVAPPTDPIPTAGPTPDAPAAESPPETTSAPTNSNEVTDSLDASAAIITPQIIAQRQKELSINRDLDDETRQRVSELYAKSEANLERLTFLKRRRAEFQSLTKTAATRGQAAEQGIAKAKEIESQTPTVGEVVELEQLLSEHQDKLKTLKDEKSQLDEQATKRSARRNEARQRMAEIDAEIDDLRKQAVAGTVVGESPLLAEAKRIEILCHLRVAKAEKPTLEEELRLYDNEAAVKLLQTKRSLNAIQLETWREQVLLTTKALQQAREQTAAEALANATENENKVPPLLRPIAEKSRLLAEKNRQLTRQIQSSELRQQAVHGRLDELKQKFSTTQAKVDTVGLPASIGAMLRNQRTTLPEIGMLRSSSQTRAKVINEVQLDIFDLDEERSRLGNVHTEAERLVQQLSLDNPDFADSDNVAIAEGLLNARREVLDSLHSSYTTLFDSLTDTSIAEEELIRQSETVRDYIDERVLWVRSHPPLLARLTPEEWTSEKSSWKVWLDFPLLVPALVQDAISSPMVYAPFLLFTVILMFARPVFAARLRRISEMVRSSAYSHFYPSLAALLINGISCLALPTLLAFVGWRMGILDSPQPLARVLGRGLMVGSLVVLPLMFFSRAFAKDGLADAHFDWTQHTAVLMRANIRWGAVLLVPLVIVGVTMFNLQSTAPPGIAHRVVFVLACFSVTCLTWRFLHPRHGLPKEFLELHSGGWFERLKGIWFWGLLGIPLSLAVLAILGYSYTAHELAWRGFASIAIVALLWILHGLSMRLLLVHRRRLAVEQARARFAEYKRQREEEAARFAAATPAVVPIPQTDEERVIANLPGVSVTSSGLVMGEDPLAELRANTEQSRRLVSTIMVGAAILMLWMTWHNVLPALGFLERWPLWNSSKEIAETITTEAGLVQTRSREVIDPVTIADVFFAFFVAVVGFIAARDLPGLLELAVLQKLPLEKSVRYAITTISSYLAVAIGLFVAFRLVGLRWQQIQWMATALTFGLAFGLQEMFANFVAGIILLFERPIRVGDIVTIDEVTGVVSRVRMRATTVTNFDCKDYVVPNKDFITGRLLNWTLSDHVNRVSITVGIAYGSDTNKAKMTLIRIANEHPLVEADPPPAATFEEFQTSSLQIVLRCFISMANMPMRLSVIDQLHTAIDTAFQAEGIEIAFPQQDIHIRTSGQSLPAA